MKTLTTPSGKKIVVKHVVTVDYALDTEAYRNDSMKYGWYSLKIREYDGSDEAEAFRVSLEQLYPKGKPQVDTYYKTKVTATDGQTYWVEQKFEDVVRAVLDAG
jgi:uncharacterized protein YlzI (FlbEa/FlbD family)